MFEKPQIDDLSHIINGEIMPPDFWKLNEDKTDLIPKSEEEILADDWNKSIERKCEYESYLNIKIYEMQNYLNETDWYVSRKIETGKDIPEEVSLKRNEFRNKISDFKERLQGVENE